LLVLSRKPGESIVVGGQIILTVIEVCGNRIRVGIEAPREVPVNRAEIDKRIKYELATAELPASITSMNT
jgi:carbon storage regulator